MTTGPVGKLPVLQRTNSLKAPVATILGYGPGGAGKTRSVQTIVDAGFNPIILRTELGKTGGLLSIATPPETPGIAFVVIESHQQMMDVIRELKKKKGTVSYGADTFDYVVLDSLTHWGNMPLDRFVEMKGWQDLQTPEGGKDPRQAYGYLAEKGNQLYKELFDLDGHLYVIAREGLFGGQDGEPLFSAPELPGQKLPREVPGWPDATVRLRVVAGQHVMITKGEGGTPARVRTPLNFPELPLRCKPDIGALTKFMCGDRTAIDALRLLSPQEANKLRQEEKRGLPPAQPKKP